MMNGLNFDGEEEIAPGVKAFRFATPDGRRYYERDPLKAMNLGMPPPNFANANAGPAPSRGPDLRLASNAPMSVAPDEEPQMSQETMSVAPTPEPEAPPPPHRDPAAEFEQALGNAVPLPQRFKRAVAREAGYRPQSMQVSGADPNAVQKLSDEYDALEQRRAAVAEAQLGAAEENAANERINARVQRMDAEDKLAKQERVVKLKEEDKRRHMAMLDAEEQQMTKRSPDTERIFKQKGSGTYFLTALMRGLGELGAAMRRDGRNSTAELIDRRIDQDIAEQESEIAADKDAVAKRKNAYAAMLADGLDPEFAREKLRWMQSLQAEAVAREAAAETSSQQARAYFLQQADERAVANLEFKKGLLDKQSVKIDSKYDQGSRGGLVEDPNYYNKLEKAVKARNTIRAENMGTTPDAYESGKKTEATNAASGGNGKLATSIVAPLNEAISNLRAADQATGDLQAVLNKGGDVNLSPSGFRNWQPVDEFVNGKRSADEDRFGKEGALVRDIIGKEMTSTRNAALGTLSESDKRNQTDNAIGDGNPETVMRYMQGKKASYQSQVVQVFNSMGPAEQQRVLESADPKTRAMIQEALSGQRVDTDALDARKE